MRQGMFVFEHVMAAMPNGKKTPKQKILLRHVVRSHPKPDPWTLSKPCQRYTNPTLSATNRFNTFFAVNFVPCHLVGNEYSAHSAQYF